MGSAACAQKVYGLQANAADSFRGVSRDRWSVQWNASIPKADKDVSLQNPFVPPVLAMGACVGRVSMHPCIFPLFSSLTHLLVHLLTHHALTRSFTHSLTHQNGWVDDVLL